MSPLLNSSASLVEQSVTPTQSAYTDNRWPPTFAVVSEPAERSERELSSAARAHARPSPQRRPADAAVNYSGRHSSLFLGPATVIEFPLEKKLIRWIESFPLD